jgi:ferredoxin
MRYCVDENLCTGHGRCYTVASEVFSADDDGWNADRGKTVTVAPGREEAAELGARSCPERAIAIEGEEMSDGPAR